MKRKQRRIAAALSIVIVAIPLAAFMPWSGTAEAERYSGEPTPIISPSPLLTLAPEPEEQEYIPDAAEVEALAKMLYGEARGIASDMEKAACVWCVLNRVDDPRFPDTVLEVLEAPYQFAGYSADYPVLPELATLAADVLIRYHAERDGGTNSILLFRRRDRMRRVDAETCFRSDRRKDKEKRTNRTGNGYRRKRGFIND